MQSSDFFLQSSRQLNCSPHPVHNVYPSPPSPPSLFSLPSPSPGVDADHFAFMGLRIENTAGEPGSQAVALRTSGDQIIGFESTLSSFQVIRSLNVFGVESSLSSFQARKLHLFEAPSIFIVFAASNNFSGAST